MLRAIAPLTIVLVLPVYEPQVPTGFPRTVTIAMTGTALSAGAAQEAIMIGVPWVDFGDQLFPRQNVRVRMEYIWQWNKTLSIADDAREKGFDYGRARFLFGTAGFYDRRPYFTLLTDTDRPELKRAAYWLLEQLTRLELNVDREVKEDRQMKPDPERYDPVLWIRLEK